MYLLWFLVYQRVLPQLHLHILLHHLHHRISYLISTDTPKIQYLKEVEVRVKSFGETRCMNPQKPKKKWGARRSTKRYIAWITWLATGIQREFGWWKHFNRALEKPSARESRHFQVISWTSNGAASKRGTGFGKAQCVYAPSEGPNCDICLKTKMTRASCRRRAGTVVPGAEHFSDLITADHKVLSEESESRNNHRYAVVVQGLATQWIQPYTCKSKSSQETEKNLMRLETKSHLYRPFLRKFGKSCEELSWNHCTSTPHRSETNVIAEKAVHRVKEGTSVVLLQSGLGDEWWSESLECYTYLRNIQDLLSDGKTPCKWRFGMPFDRPVIPFGAMVECHPISAKDQSRLHQFGAKVLPCIFLGYAQRGGIWKGDIMKADIEELWRWRIWTPRQKAQCKGSVNAAKKWKLHIPKSQMEQKNLWEEQRLRTPTLIREHPIRGEGHVDFLGESEGSLPPPEDSLPDAGEAINDFWSMEGNFIYRHHVEPRVKLYSPREEPFLLR